MREGLAYLAFIRVLWFVLVIVHVSLCSGYVWFVWAVGRGLRVHTDGAGERVSSDRRHGSKDDRSANDVNHLKVIVIIIWKENSVLVCEFLSPCCDLLLIDLNLWW
jgi:hypothetical protein